MRFCWSSFSNWLDIKRPTLFLPPRRGVGRSSQYSHTTPLSWAEGKYKTISAQSRSGVKVWEFCLASTFIVASFSSYNWLRATTENTRIIPALSQCSIRRIRRPAINIECQTVFFYQPWGIILTITHRRLLGQQISCHSLMDPRAVSLNELFGL